MTGLIVLVVMVLAETWGISQAIQRFGGGVTAALLLAGLVTGVWLIKRGGLTAMRQMQQSLARQELPGVGVFAGLITAFAGLLLLLPGFVSDALGLSMLIGGFGLRQRLGERMQREMQAKRPDLKAPVTIEGEFREKPRNKLPS